MQPYLERVRWCGNQKVECPMSKPPLMAFMVKSSFRYLHLRSNQASFLISALSVNKIFLQ